MASPLQAITRRFPSFVSEPLSGLLGRECYTTLIYNTDFGDTRCLRLAISKGLGLGIVLGGGIVKVPQILKILRSKSARGLSLSSYLLDTASLLLVDVYNVRLSFPFSTYGENVALTIQNIVITVLILAYSYTKGTPWGTILLFLFATGAITAALSSSHVTPIPLLRTLVAASIPLSLSAKIPQIVSNHRANSTGQLSAFLVFNSLAGCLARVFTTATETGDSVLWWGFASAAALNGVLAAQMLLYWRDEDSDRAATKRRRDPPMRSNVAGSSSPKLGSPTQQRRVPSGQWSRKAA